ncbi:hypothetical protein DH2020_006286 [Rehmannia glutinosa]|uniref:Uncharacterized protein n=1 Tax=Rehmannia glutinosa TaxID=99300 RepID=A0ABR0XIF4_REHGL
MRSGSWVLDSPAHPGQNKWRHLWENMSTRHEYEWVWIKGRSLKRPARDFDDLLARAEKYVNLEEVQKGKKEEKSDKKKDMTEVHWEAAQKWFREQERRSRLVPRSGEPRLYTPLMASKARVLMAIAGNKDLKWPTNYSAVPSMHKSKFFCEFHNDFGHTTEECRHLQDEIEWMVGGWVTIDQSEKTHARVEIQPVMEVGAVEEPTISFGAEDQRGVALAHNDALVITATITNFEVARVMVDTGSSVNVLFYEAYLMMGLEVEVKPVDTALFSFSEGVVEPIRKVTLPVTMGDKSRHKTRMVSFLNVDSYSTYNVIIGRPTLNAFQAIVSTFHMKLKIIMEDGVREIVGELAKQFTLFKLEQIPREENIQADHLSKIASSATDYITRMITILSDNACILGQEVWH